MTDSDIEVFPIMLLQLVLGPLHCGVLCYQCLSPSLHHWSLWFHPSQYVCVQTVRVISALL